MYDDLRAIIRSLIEATAVQPDVLNALNAYVNDSRAISPGNRAMVSRFVESQSIHPPRRLERIESNDPEWNVGDVVKMRPKSFTMASVLNNEKMGHVGWKSSDKALCCIEHATKGWIVDYSLIKVPFSASQEREVIVSGDYRVVGKQMVPEPFTNPSYGYKVPMYVLIEV